MPFIDVSEADAHECPFNEFSPCRGSRCMAWAWSGPAFDYTETSNLHETPEGLRPVGTPPEPQGGIGADGWEPDGPSFNKGYHRSAKDNLPPALAQRWRKRRPKQMGCCGRVAPGYDHDYQPF